MSIESKGLGFGIPGECSSKKIPSNGVLSSNGRYVKHQLLSEEEKRYLVGQAKKQATERKIPVAWSEKLALVQKESSIKGVF